MKGLAVIRRLAWAATFVFVLARCTGTTGDHPTATAAEADAKLPARTIEFPADVALGKISIGDPGTTGTVNWKELGEAKGKVEIPAGKVASLRISPEGGKNLAALAKLGPNDIQHLSLRKVPAAAADLAPIAKLTGLKRLVLAKTGTTDEGVKVIAGLKELEQLDLSINKKITNIGAENLKGLENLRRLDLAQTGLGDAALANLKGMKNLEELRINRIRISDAGLEHIKDMKSIKRLSLSSTKVTDKGIPTLANLPLVWLELEAQPKVTAKSLPELAKIKSLKYLNVKGIKAFKKMGEAGDLQKALPGIELKFK